MNPKEKILDVTLRIIKSEGFDQITIRRIAKEAKVNIAMINYYFGSKDNLISQAVGLILQDARKSFDYLYLEELTPKERLKQFLFHYAQVAMENPEAFRKFILKGSFDYESQKQYMDYLKSSGSVKILQTLSELTGIEDRDTLLMMTVQRIGAVFFPCLMQPLIKEALSIEIAVPPGSAPCGEGLDARLRESDPGKADAGLLIHEGQLTYGAAGLEKIVDLGEWWLEETGLPLPLGTNVARRDLGPDVLRELSAVLAASIRAGLDNRERADLP